MLTSDWLRLATRRLEKAGVGTARLDALVLLEDCLNKNRAHLLAHPRLKLTFEQIRWLDRRVSRRANHEPLAYICGKTEFYGREFYIDHRVLEPRPESETMIDMLKSLAAREPLTIIDVGTGSGALAITAKLEIPIAQVLAVDIDKKCLEVARKNARKLSAEIEFFRDDLLAPIPLASLASNYVVLANLPYIPDSFTINQAAMNEPRTAIFGGVDGLDIYRRLFEQINYSKARPKIIFTESLPPQHKKLAKIASTSDYKLAITDDFIQQFELS